MGNIPNKKATEHPRETFGTPVNVLKDKSLSEAEKIAILHHWKQEIELRLSAEAEGMGRYTPISSEKESSLAEEERAVGKALSQLERHA